MRTQDKNTTSKLTIGVCDASGSTTSLLQNRLMAESSIIIRTLDWFMEAPDVPQAMGDIDLVLIDLDNDEIHGFEVANLIREFRISRPEILFVSSNPRISVAECQQAGGLGIIEKPLNIAALRTLTTQAIERRHSLRFDVASYPSLIKSSKTTLDSKVKNIGRGGFFFEFPLQATPPTVGEVLEFSINIEAFPNYTLKGKGIVRWIKGGTQPGAGIEFIDIADDDNSFIKAFVELFRIKAYVPSSENN